MPWAGVHECPLSAAYDGAVEESPFLLIATGFVLVLGGIFFLSNGVFALTNDVTWLRVLEVAVALACILGGWLIGRSMRQKGRHRDRR